jgi:GT2 family glycosyltransferase
LSQISLVLLTYNRSDECARAVAQAFTLPARPPVIVVDNASRDGTARRIEREFPQAEVLRLPRNIGAAGRNVGIARASTPYVACGDDDTSWAPGSLERAMALLERHPRIAVLTARLLVGSEEREDPVSTLMARSPLPSDGLPGRAILGFLAGASVFRRRAFLEAGGYEPRFFLGGEETLLAYDLAARGWSMVYCDRLTVHHYPSRARDVAARRRLLERNALWVALMRRPWSVVWRELRRTPPRPLLAALRGLPWALARRRVLPAEVEARCALVEQHALNEQRCGAVPRTA